MDDLLHDVLMEAERRAQGGMSVDQGIHCPLQSRPIEGSAQSPQCRHVIGGEPRLQLVQEPEAGLPKGGGIDLAVRWPGAWQGGRDGDVQRGRGGETFPQPGDATRQVVFRIGRQRSGVWYPRFRIHQQQVEGVREPADTRIEKDETNIELHAERLFQTVNRTEAGKGITAQQEEIGIAARAIEAEDRGEYACDQLLHLATGR